MVEFALVLFPFVLLLLGIAWFATAINGSIDETHLVTTAARFAAVNNQEPEKGVGLLQWTKEHSDISSCKTAKTEKEQKEKEQITQGCEATWCSPTSKIGDYVEVKLRFKVNWEPITKLFEHFGAKLATSTVTSTAQMRIEVAPSPEYPTKCEF